MIWLITRGICIIGVFAMSVVMQGCEKVRVDGRPESSQTQKASVSDEASAGLDVDAEGGATFFL